MEKQLYLVTASVQASRYMRDEDEPAEQWTRLVWGESASDAEGRFCDYVASLERRYDISYSVRLVEVHAAI